MVLSDSVRFIGRNVDGLNVYHLVEIGYWVAPAHVSIINKNSGTALHYHYSNVSIDRPFNPSQLHSFKIALRAFLVVIKNMHGLFKRRLDARWFFGGAGAPTRGHKHRMYYHLYFPPSLRQVYSDLPKMEHRSFRAKDKDAMLIARNAICKRRHLVLQRFIRDYTYPIGECLTFTDFDDHITYVSQST